MQVSPDRCMSGTQDDLQKYLGSEPKLNGPGLYIGPMEFALLVVAGDVPWGTEWNQIQPKDTWFHYCYYGVGIEHTVFGSSTLPPTRLDTR